MRLTIHLKTYSNFRGFPSFAIILNGNILTNTASCKNDNIILEYNNLQLDDTNFLHIVHYDKKSNYTEVVDGKVISDVAVEINKIEIDGIQISEKYLWTQYFFPNWSYPPNPITPMMNNRYLGFNGTWQFIFPRDYKGFIVSHYVDEKFLD